MADLGSINVVDGGEAMFFFGYFRVKIGE